MKNTNSGIMSNDEMKITFRFAKNRAEKHKWMCRFLSSYSGKYNQPSEDIYGNLCKFIIAESNGKELGFIRITDYSSEFGRFGCKTLWNLSDAYVKPAYRHRGVLRNLIQYAVKNHHVKTIRAETKRLEINQGYYKALGFTQGIAIGNGEMAIVYLDEVNVAIENRLKYYQDHPGELPKAA